MNGTSRPGLLRKLWLIVIGGGLLVFLPSCGGGSSSSGPGRVPINIQTCSQKAQLNAINPPMSPADQDWNTFNNDVVPAPYLTGVNPYVPWNSIETSQGHYDYTTLDGELTNYISAGKKINLIIQPISFGAVNNPGGGVNTYTPSYVVNQVDVVTCSDYPGNGSAGTGFPVVYEPGFMTPYQTFIADVLNHYAGNSNIGYIRFGLSVGGEANPYCIPQLQALPAPYTYSSQQWITYVQDMDGFEKSQNVGNLQLLQSLNAAGGDLSVADAEAAAAAQNGFGFGSNGLRQEDISAAQTGTPCTSDWCALFAKYPSVPHELQTATASNPSGQGTTGSLEQLLPFAVNEGATILEIYTQDWLNALGPSQNTAYQGTLQSCGQ